MVNFELLLILAEDADMSLDEVIYHLAAEEVEMSHAVRKLGEDLGVLVPQKVCHCQMDDLNRRFAEIIVQIAKDERGHSRGSHAKSETSKK